MERHAAAVQGDGNWEENGNGNDDDNDACHDDSAGSGRGSSGSVVGVSVLIELQNLRVQCKGS